MLLQVPVASRYFKTLINHSQNQSISRLRSIIRKTGPGWSGGAMVLGKRLGRGGRVVRWCWVNFQCRGVLLIWITVGQGPTALTVGAGGCCLDIFTLIYPFSLLSPSLWETARDRLKYCLKGPLNPKQPTNQRKTGTSKFQ